MNTLNVILWTLWGVLAWAFGSGACFFYFKNMAENLQLGNVKTTLYLTAFGAFALSLFGALNGWHNFFLLFLYAAVAFFVTYKFTPKSKFTPEVSNDGMLAKGSMAEAEKKQDMWLFIGLSVITVLCFLCVYAFNTIPHDLMVATHANPNRRWMVAIGVLGFIISEAGLIYGWLADPYGKGKVNPVGVMWIGGIIVGIFFSTGFYQSYL